MKILSYRRFALWWQLAMDWFQRQFAAIAASIDFTPVEDKLDDVKSDVADVKTAVENIDFSTLAKDATVAKQGTNPNATNTAILAAFGNIDFSTLAKEVQVKDGNDTAISVGKDIRSKVGTGSDTAAETGTLFAVVKWVKDKVKSIFDFIGTPASGQPNTLFAAIAAGGGDEQGKQDLVNALVSCKVPAAMQDTLTTLANKVQQYIQINTLGSTFIDTPLNNDIINVGTCNWYNVRRLVVAGLPYIGNTSYATVSKYSVYNMSNITSVESEDVTTISEGFGGGCQNIQAVILPKASALLPINYYLNIFRSAASSKVRHIVTGSVSILDGGPGNVNWYNASNVLLYDVQFAMGISKSISLDKWNPTSALNATLTTIMDVDIWDDPNQPQFANNREKFLWYFENHFIPSFNVVTNSPTLTLLSSVYNVANTNYSAQDPTKTLLQLIEDKGWTVASA